MDGVTLDTVDGSVMLSRLDAKAEGNFDLLLSLVGLQDEALLGAD